MANREPRTPNAERRTPNGIVLQQEGVDTSEPPESASSSTQRNLRALCVSVVNPASFLSLVSRLNEMS
jgi:hypothetical protein